MLATRPVFVPESQGDVVLVAPTAGSGSWPVHLLGRSKKIGAPSCSATLWGNITKIQKTELLAAYFWHETLQKKSSMELSVVKSNMHQAYVVRDTTTDWTLRLVSPTQNTWGTSQPQQDAQPKRLRLAAQRASWQGETTQTSRTLQSCSILPRHCAWNMKSAPALSSQSRDLSLASQLWQRPAWTKIALTSSTTRFLGETGPTFLLLLPHQHLPN